MDKDMEYQNWKDFFRHLGDKMVTVDVWGIETRFTLDELFKHFVERMSEEGGEIITPDIFNKKVRSIVLNFGGDPEACHGELDDLMEKTLISIGYGEGVKVLRSTTRWYS